MGRARLVIHTSGEASNCWVAASTSRNTTFLQVVRATEAVRVQKTAPNAISLNLSLCHHLCGPRNLCKMHKEYYYG